MTAPTLAQLQADAAAISVKSPAIRQFALDAVAYLQAQTASLPQATAAAPSWVGDFSTGDFSQFDIAENAANVVNDPIVGSTAGVTILPEQVPGYAASTKLCRVVASDGLPTSGGGAASTLWCHGYYTAAWLQPGASTWFRSMFLLPDGANASYPGVFLPRSGDGLGSTWHVLTEWHLDDSVLAAHGGITASSSTYVGIGWGGAAPAGGALLLRPIGGAYGSTQTKYFYETDTTQTAANDAATGATLGAIQPLKRNHWYDILVCMTLSADPASGYLEWWVDGNKRFADHYPTLNGAKDGFVAGCGFEGGLYRHTGLEPNSPNDFVYQGPMLAGPTRASVGA